MAIILAMEKSNASDSFDISQNNYFPPDPLKIE